jgi:tetratricopeptide (TPR) repeat protein
MAATTGQGATDAAELSIEELAAFAETSVGDLATPRRRAALSTLEARLEVLRASLDREPQTAAEADAIRRLAVVLVPFWRITGRTNEGSERLRRTVALTAGSDDSRARALEALGMIAYSQGAFEEAESFFNSSLNLLSSSSPDGVMIARLMDRLGLAYREMGRYEESRNYHSRALAIWRDNGDTACVGLALGNLGVVARELGQLAEARRLLLESLAAREQSGELLGVASALGNLGTLAAMQGRLDEAAALHERCLSIRRSLDDSWGVAAALNNLGTVARLRGDLELAQRRHSEALALIIALEDQLGLCETLEAVSGLLASKGDAAGAAQMLGAADALRSTLGAKRPRSREGDCRDVMATVAATLHERASEVYEHGLHMTRSDAVELLNSVLDRSMGGAEA